MLLAGGSGLGSAPLWESALCLSFPCLFIVDSSPCGLWPCQEPLTGAGGSCHTLGLTLWAGHLEPSPGRQEGQSWGQSPCPGWQMTPLVFPLLCPSTAPAEAALSVGSSTAHGSSRWSLGATVLQLKPGGSSFPATQPCCKPREKCSLCQKPAK